MLERELLGTVNVDSGRLMVIDPCYVKYLDDEALINEAHNVIYLANQGGEIGHGPTLGNLGIAFTSGFGDGTYEVWASYVKIPKLGKRISKVEIILIEGGEQNR